MSRQSKSAIWILFGIVAVVLLVFVTGYSEGLEITIIYIVGGLSCLLFIIGALDKKNKTQKILVGVLGVGFTLLLMLWSDHNKNSRFEREMTTMREKYAEYAKQDSLQHIKDSIQNYQDSLVMVEDSKRLYEQEGDLIFGDFKFGMSETQCEAAVKKIERETDGRISIADHDFKIKECKFHENKLYSIKLTSANTWVRYYYKDAHEYDDSEGLGTGYKIIEKIKERLMLKYGKPNNSGNWHFTYKDIYIDSHSIYSNSEGLLRTEFWAIVLIISNPLIAEEAQKAEIEEKKKYDNEKRVAEEELKSKKEAFSKGLKKRKMEN